MGTELLQQTKGKEQPLTIDRIKAKTITVGIVGLGYVGLPLSLGFAEAGVRVLGFDIDESKIQAINAGKCYIRHMNPDRLQDAREKGLIFGTSDFRDIARCDAVIICVPTPLNRHLEPDLKYIVATCKAIAPHVKKQSLISLESTSWPGTTDEVVKTLLEEEGSLTMGEDFYLCFSPEREDPGNRLYDTKNIPKLIGGCSEESLSLGAALYSLAIDEVVPMSNAKTAELAKLFENIFRSVNIALVNELKMICEPMNIDVWEVIQAAGTKPFGIMPFWPGPGLGGHCVPIDPFYLTWKAKQYGVATRFIELAGEINRFMPKFVLSKVQDCLNSFEKPLNKSRILILGLAYKTDVDDMRESPSLELIKILEEKGAVVDYYDPLIPEIGCTRQYPHLIGKKHKELSKNYDCFLLSTHHSCFSKEEMLSLGVPIVDTRHVFPSNHPLVFPA
ncbi:MAG: nucleotide sugar dehydrogenase [Waddliaceae bacterium]